jgi:4-amino-4-deoxy-L-arabinose transferase-like glycosyltransferase
MRAPRAFWGALVCLELAVLLLHRPSFHLPHGEGDEVAFVFLAERLAEHPLRYHVQGALEGAAARRFIDDTWVRMYAAGGDEALREHFARLERAELLWEPLPGPRRYAYDPAIYDRPLFVHPPLYPVALSAFRRGLGAAGGPLLSMLLHAATVWLTAVLGRRWGGPRLGLVAAALVAVDPVSWLCGSRLWIDGMTEAMAAAAVLAAARAVEREGAAPFALAGLVFGLACWTKLTVALVAPAIVTTWLVAARRPPLRRIALWVACAATVVGVWLVVSRTYLGTWIAAPRPTPWILEQNPYVRFVTGRSRHFYVSGLVLVAPVLLWCLPGLVRRRAERWVWVPAVWAVAVLGGMTFVSAAGHGGGYQLRYVAPAMPALALLAAAGVTAAGAWWSVPAVALAALGFDAGSRSAAEDGVADPVPFALADALGRVGLNLSELFPGLW